MADEDQNSGAQPEAAPPAPEENEESPAASAAKLALKTSTEEGGAGFLGAIAGFIGIGEILFVVLLIVLIAAFFAVFAHGAGISGGTTGGTTGGGSCGAQTMALPLKASDMAGGFNYNRHGLSISDPTDKPGHNTIMNGQKRYSGLRSLDIKGLGEAVDISTKSGSHAYAPFAGTIVDSQDLGLGTGDFIIIQSQDKCLLSAVAHLEYGHHLTSGQVTPGQEVGSLKDSIGHLHFELIANGTPINAGQISDGQCGKIWDADKKFIAGGGA